MNIGLFFGSFNPIHVGHLIIANQILNETKINKVWFVVSPQNPFKINSFLLNENDRFHLVRLSIENDSRMKATNIEFKLPRPSYTVDTLAYLKEKYPKNSFSIIMGSDSFLNLNKWKNFEIIINDYKIYVYKRAGIEVVNSLNAQTTILDAPIIQISSSQIRELIKQKKSIRYLVPDNVREEIESRKLFSQINQKK